MFNIPYILGFLLTIQLCLAQKQLFPDLHCHPDIDLDALKAHNEYCKRLVKRPFERPCPRACIIERLGLIIAPPVDDLNFLKEDEPIMDVEDASTGEQDFPGLKELFKNKEAGMKAAADVLAQCGELTKTTLIEKKKTCEGWGKIYTCVQKALCATKPLWPEVKCIPGFNPKPLHYAKALCQQQIELPTKRPCYKSCVLQALGILGYHDEGQGKEKMTWFGRPCKDSKSAAVKKNRLLESDDYDSPPPAAPPPPPPPPPKDNNDLFELISYNKDMFRGLAKDFEWSCGSILNKARGTKCEEWKELYDCIEGELKDECPKPPPPRPPKPPAAPSSKKGNAKQKMVPPPVESDEEAAALQRRRNKKKQKNSGEHDQKPRRRPSMDSFER